VGPRKLSDLPTLPRYRRSVTPTSLYHLATPLFALLDFGWDLPVRVAGLGASRQRGAYYVVLLLLGLLCRVRPGASFQEPPRRGA
jgi:hypothetical protein